MMRRWIAVGLLTAMLVGMAWGGVVAQERDAAEAGGLLVYDVWVRPTAAELEAGATPEPPIPGTVSGGYLTIENTSDVDYALVGVESGIAEMTHVHETTRNGEMVGMRMVRAVEIPAGATVLLETGGTHAMLMNLIRDIHPGEAIPMTLTFEDASGMRFEMQVAGLAMDFAPEGSEMTAANVQASWNADGTALDVTLMLINRGTEADRLEAVTSDAGTAEAPDAADVPAGATQAMTVRLGEFAETPGDGLMARIILTLEFASGDVVTVGAAVITAEDDR